MFYFLKILVFISATSFPLSLLAAEKKENPKPLSMSEILEISKDSDWRPLDQDNTIYMYLPSGRVIIEMAPLFAPNHVANIKALARENYFDGLAIVRAQENYVVQWGDPNDEKPELRKAVKTGKSSLPAEFDGPWDAKKPFVKLKDGDIFAPEVGFSNGFHAARDLKTKTGWLTHCYSYVGAGRDTAKDSGSGKELYVVIGQPTRLLDRNVTLIGRVVEGMELLTVLPRGKGKLGFYDKSELNVPIKSIKVGSDLPENEKADLEVMKTDTKTFQDLIQSRRHRPEEWFVYRPNKIDICTVPIPVRTKPKK